MDKSDQDQNSEIANSPDYDTVCICFQDLTINTLFSELLQTQGARTVIVRDIRQLDGNVKVVTEPRFFRELDPRYHGRCLVVGNKDTLREINALSLSRPLTEEKVEKALHDLMNCR